MKIVNSKEKIVWCSETELCKSKKSAEDVYGTEYCGNCNNIISIISKDVLSKEEIIKGYDGDDE